MTDYAELKRLVDRVLTDHRFCGDENHKALADGVLALIAEKDSAHKHWQNESNNVQALVAEVCRLKAELEKVQLIGRLAYNFDGYKAVLDERDQLKAENEALRKDAERYQWLRLADWWRSPICVIRNPKEQAKLGSDCPTGERLDSAVDAAMGNGEQS